MRKHVDFETPNFAELATGPQPWHAYATRVLQLQPRAYYRALDAVGQTLPDATGHGHDAQVTRPTVTPATPPAALAHDANPAIHFDHGRAQAAPHPDLSGFNDFTILFWLRLQSLPATGTHYLLNVYQTANNQRAWAVVMVGDSQNRLRLNLSNDGSSIQTLNVARINFTDLTLNHWHMIAFRRWDGVVACFLDGEMKLEQASTSTLHASAAPFTIGERSDEGQSTWAGGDLDEIALFNHALTANAISDLHRTGLGVFAKDTHAFT